MRLLFLGSPAIAVPFLEECVRQGHEVAAVLTQPDKPSGRGLAMAAPPVKEAALRLGLRVLQPEKPSSVAEELRAMSADLAVVVAYGRLLKADVLAAPKLGCVNVHFSLLPKYRGAAPMQWALIRGESRTGVSIFWLDEGMDTGPLQSQAALDVRPEDDALTLAESLTRLGVAQLGRALADIAAGKARREPQRGEPSLAPKLAAEAARLCFDRPAEELHNRVRGLRAGPKAYVTLKAAAGAPQRLTLLKTALESSSGEGLPGSVVRVEPRRGILIQCSPGRLWILEVQPEGKRQLLAADFLNGLRLSAGDRLETAA